MIKAKNESLWAILSLQPSAKGTISWCSLLSWNLFPTTLCSFWSHHVMENSFMLFLQECSTSLLLLFAGFHAPDLLETSLKFESSGYVCEALGWTDWPSLLVYVFTLTFQDHFCLGREQRGCKELSAYLLGSVLWEVLFDGGLVHFDSLREELAVLICR